MAAKSKNFAGLNGSRDSPKHNMSKTDMARIFLAKMEGPRMESGAFTTAEDISMKERGGFAFGGQVGAREASYDASIGEYSYGEEPTDIFGDPTTRRGILEAEFFSQSLPKPQWDGEMIGPRFESGAFTPAADRQMRESWRETQTDAMGAVRDERMSQAQRLRKADATANRREYNRIGQLYSRLGTEIRKEPNALKRQALIQERNALINEGQNLAQTLGIERMPGVFPFVQPTATGVGATLGATIGSGALGGAATERLGRGAGIRRGSMFRGTSYSTTGAINGVMKALAGMFILFIFIGVFYLVFGPIYDSLIFNFTNIVSADGDATLGGKSIPALYDNVAKVILVWVPLIVFAGALYKLTALVFERESGSRTTEESEWDLMGSMDNTDLDMGSDPSVFESYGGGW